MSERWQEVHKKLHEGYRPEHRGKEAGYCDACNLPACLRYVGYGMEVENPYYNHLRGPHEQWKYQGDKIVRKPSPGGVKFREFL